MVRSKQQQASRTKLHTNKAAASAQNIIVPITKFLIKMRMMGTLKDLSEQPEHVACNEVPRPVLGGY